MRRRSILAVVFDLDGLLLDSERMFDWIITEKLCVRKVPREIRDSTIGTSEHRTWKLLFEGGYTKLSKKEFVKRVWELASLSEIPKMPNALSTVRKLHAQGVPLGLASSSRKNYVFTALKNSGLARYFQAVASGDEVPRLKPSPGVYLLSARRLGISPKNCLAVEDSSTGIVAAKRAGMVACAVPSKRTRHHDFSRADYVIGNLSGLPKILAEINENI